MALLLTGVQKAAGCIVGQDYPHPIVEHSSIVKINMARMKAAYDRKKYGKRAEETEHALPPALRQVGCASGAANVVKSESVSKDAEKVAKKARRK